jgi:recombination protein RecA
VYSTKPHIPSGSFVINTLIGGNSAADGKGQTCPGYPRRKIIEIYGPEASGKTTAALEAIVEIQKEGGNAVFLDFEHALHHGYARTIGVDFDESRLLYYKPNTLEEGVKLLFVAISKGVDLVVVDSVAAMVPQAEMEKSPGDPRKIGAQAAAFSDVMPKLVVRLTRGAPDYPEHEGTTVLFLNQIRSKISAGGGKGAGDNEDTSGGKAIKFYADVRLRISRVRSEYLKRKDPMTGKDRTYPIGTFTNVKVVKNKEDATNGYNGEIYIRYGYGIDDVLTVIEAAVARKLARRNGSTYEWSDLKVVGRDKFRTALMEQPAKLAELEDQIRKSFMTVNLDEIELDDDDEIASIEADLNPSLTDDEILAGESDAATDEMTTED